MENIILNETPKRTSKSFGINNIVIKDFEMPKIKEFINLKMESEVEIKNENIQFEPKYTIGEDLVEQINKTSQNYVINIDKEISKPIILEFTLDEKQNVLVDNITIFAKKNSKANVILKYKTKNNEVKAYHNGVCQVFAEASSQIKVTILNLLNLNSENYYSMNNKIAEKAKLEYIIADFGGNKTISNYYSNLEGESADNKINTMYLGAEEQLLDLNYVSEVYGKKANVDIEVYGALKDNARKNFKGTIDLKKGCKKAKGNENEYCMILSKTAKSKALPMLLCSEEDVQGNHSNSAGKIDEQKLYYIMTRGISKEEAQKLIVKAKFSSILEKIEDENTKKELIEEIDRRLK